MAETSNIAPLWCTAVGLRQLAAQIGTWFICFIAVDAVLMMMHRLGGKEMGHPGDPMGLSVARLLRGRCSISRPFRMWR